MTDLIGLPVFLLLTWAIGLYIHKRLDQWIAKPFPHVLLSTMLAASFINTVLGIVSTITGWLSGRITFP